MTDILLIEDNIELAQLIRAFLEKEGFSVQHFDSGEAALEFLSRKPVKILLLDIMLPGIDGFAVSRKVREHGSVPIIIMSACSGKSDQLMGFELGADDYLEKPVDPEILTAKVKALMQRTYGASTETDFLISGSMVIDRNSRKVLLHGAPIELNVKEYELLQLLAFNPGKTLHKDYLFAQIWGMDSFSENQTLTVHIKMLRSKIEENPRQPKRILTVWGVGYRYEEI